MKFWNRCKNGNQWGEERKGEKQGQETVKEIIRYLHHVTNALW